MHTVVSLEVALALEFLVRFCVVNEVQPVNNNNNNNNNKKKKKKKKSCSSSSTPRPIARPRSN